jgi:sporulation protein YlmC with PRC-barrel domain
LIYCGLTFDILGDFLTSVDEIFGKRVIDLKGFIMGDIKGVAADFNDWRITHLHVQLDDKAADELGFKKRFGSSTVCIPVSLVSAIGDVVTIGQALIDLRDRADIHECRK